MDGLLSTLDTRSNKAPGIDKDQGWAAMIRVSYLASRLLASRQSLIMVNAVFGQASPEFVIIQLYVAVSIH